MKFELKKEAMNSFLVGEVARHQERMPRRECSRLSTTAPRRRGEEVGSVGGIYSASTATVNSIDARKAMSQDFAMSHQRKDKHSHL